MGPSPDNIEARALLYASRNRTHLGRRLGDGKDGSVWELHRQSAAKVFLRQRAYERELACYQRLASHSVEQVRGHAVPRLIGSDDELLVIEMEIVTAPFLLDFADAYLDESPDFPDGVIEEWHRQKEDEFGAARWMEIQLVLATLRGQCGIYLLDVNPGNITFADDERRP